MAAPKFNLLEALARNAAKINKQCEDEKKSKEEEMKMSEEEESEVTMTASLHSLERTIGHLYDYIAYIDRMSSRVSKLEATNAALTRRLKDLQDQMDNQSKVEG